MNPVDALPTGTVTFLFTDIEGSTKLAERLGAADWGGGVGVSEGGLVGLDVHPAARVASAGHGGQVLVSSTTRALVDGALPAGVELRDLGEHRLKDLSRPERIGHVGLG